MRRKVSILTPQTYEREPLKTISNVVWHHVLNMPQERQLEICQQRRMATQACGEIDAALDRLDLCDE